MKILVTSGGTSEAIDRVRSITNHSTGRLGLVITEALIKAGYEVCLITTSHAIKPASHPNLKIIEIKNTLDLLEEMRNLVKDYQVLIHSMAVSDYTPVYMTSIDEVQASQDLSKFLTKQNTESKISSKEDAQILFLARESLKKNQADIIVANDLTQINSDQHLAYLVEKNDYQTAYSKQEIAELIIKKIQGFTF